MNRELQETLYHGITGISDAHIEHAQNIGIRKRRMEWKTRSIIAACLGLVLIAGTYSFVRFGPLERRTLPGEGSSSGGGTTVNENGPTTFMSYAGPVFPLTMLKENDHVTANRKITFDFSPYMVQEITTERRGERLTYTDYRLASEIQDKYTLVNTSGEDSTITAAYPFNGSINTLKERMPEISINGQEINPVIYSGAYSGGFTDAGDALEDTTYNLLPIENWEGYKNLLSDRLYMETALNTFSELQQPVIIYEFTGSSAPLAESEAATLAVSFQTDPSHTQVFTYKFNGAEIHDDGFRRFSYFLQENEGKRYLIVMGADIEGYEIKGYKNGACDPEDEIDDVFAIIERRETSLSDFLKDIIDITEEHGYLAYRSISELISQHGFLSGLVMDRYGGEMLDDVISDAYVQDRVFYAVFDAVIPAGASVEITAGLIKDGSYDYYGMGAGNEGVQGYDMITVLDNLLNVTEQTAYITNYDLIEIVNQNFGFDLEAGITAVDMNTDVEHYYLEVLRFDEAK